MLGLGKDVGCSGPTGQVVREAAVQWAGGQVLLEPIACSPLVGRLSYLSTHEQDGKLIRSYTVLVLIYLSSSCTGMAHIVIGILMYLKAVVCISSSPVRKSRRSV